MDYFNEELGLKVPAHVAVILDGNGRWAKNVLCLELTDIKLEVR